MTESCFEVQWVFSVALPPPKEAPYMWGRGGQFADFIFAIVNKLIAGYAVMGSRTSLTSLTASPQVCKTKQGGILATHMIPGSHKKHEK
jgi:hypothetical protein